MIVRFDGRPAIVTGAAHGFGRAIARRLAGLGATVWACDILEDEVEETAAGAAGNCIARVVDVTDGDAVQGLVDEIARKAGSVEVLINDAGGVLGQVGRPMEEVSDDDWQAIFDVNVTGVWHLCRAVAPGMKERLYGRIVNISSGAGLGISRTGIQAYAAAKAAQIGLTRQLAHELGPWGITVNSVAPGFVRSNPSTERQWESYGTEGQRALVEGIALRRLGVPDDIANAVVFLASDYAAWITGEVLSVSGGK
jgi:3-oxoacyl-[acyl-carrier protein] reductase